MKKCKKNVSHVWQCPRATPPPPPCHGPRHAGQTCGARCTGIPWSGGRGPCSPVGTDESEILYLTYMIYIAGIIKVYSGGTGPCSPAWAWTCVLNTLYKQSINKVPVGVCMSQIPQLNCGRQRNRAAHALWVGLGASRLGTPNK